MGVVFESDFEARARSLEITLRQGLGAWGYLARRPTLYRLATRLAMGVLGRLGRKRGRFASLPLAKGWTVSRDLPAPEGRTFMQQWRQRQRSRP